MATTASQSASPIRPPSADGWAIWPAVASLLITLVLAVLCGLPGLISFVLIPLVFLGRLPAAAAVIVVAVWVAARRRFKMAVSVLLALVLPVLLWQPILSTADCLHVALTVWTGMGQLGSSSRPDGSPFWVYDWSIGFAGSGDRFLIYDVTDEIALPPKLHKRPLAAESGWGEDCAGQVQRLFGHYYVCMP